MKHIKEIVHVNNLHCVDEMLRIMPSVICFDYLHLQDQLDLLKKGGIKTIHADVMDGAFVRQITIGADFINQIKNDNPDIAIDTHLMIVDPLSKIEMFAKCSDEITFHYEATGANNIGDIDECIEILDKIHSCESNIKAGIAVSPDTPIDVLKPLFERENSRKKKEKDCMALINKILIMSVKPGLSGQVFIEKSIEKIDKLSELLREFDLVDTVDIQIDGGINERVLTELLDKNIASFVVGSALHKNIDGRVCGDRRRILKNNLERFRKILCAKKENRKEKLMEK